MTVGPVRALNWLQAGGEIRIINAILLSFNKSRFQSINPRYNQFQSLRPCRTHAAVEVKVIVAALGNWMPKLMNLTIGVAVCHAIVVRGFPFRVAYLKVPLYLMEAAHKQGLG